jgi:hypothetical protein
MLPTRFQNSSFTFRQLKDNLGDDAIVAVDANTRGWVLVEQDRLVALEAETASLRSENEQLKVHIAEMSAKRPKKAPELNDKES